MCNKFIGFALVNASSGGRALTNRSIDNKKAFISKGAVLRFFNDTKSQPLFTAAIEYFAKGIDADLITVSFEDFGDLCEHLSVIQKGKKCDGVDCRIRLYFYRNHLSEDKDDKTHTLEE